MDPISIATAITGTLGFVYSIGNAFFSIRSALSLATIEFELFVQETDQFLMLWGLVEPYKAGPTPYVNDDIVQELNRLYSDAAKILNEFHRTIQVLQQEDRRFIDFKLRAAGRSGRLVLDQSGWVPSTESRVNRLKLYFNRDQIALQRVQLQYAKSHLNIILSVISVTQNGHILRNGEEMAAKIAELLEQQDTRHRHLMDEERRSSGGIQAHRWIARPPAPRLGSHPIEMVEELAQRIISPRPPGLTRTSFSGSTASPHRPSPIQQNNHLRARIAQLEATNRGLAEAVTQSHERSSNERLSDAIRTAHLWRDDHARVERRCVEAETQRERLLNNLRASERERTELEGRVSALQTQLSVRRHVDENREADLRGQNDQLQDRVNELTTLNDGWRAYVDRLTERHQAREADLQQQIQVAQARTQTLEQNNVSRVLYQQLQQANARTQNNLVRAQGESQQRAERIRRLEEERRRAIDRVNILQEEKRRLRVENNEYQATVRRLRERVGTLEAQVRRDGAAAEAHTQRQQHQIRVLEENVAYFRAHTEHLRARLYAGRREMEDEEVEIGDRTDRRQRESSTSRSVRPDRHRNKHRRWTRRRRKRSGLFCLF